MIACGEGRDVGGERLRILRERMGDDGPHLLADGGLGLRRLAEEVGGGGRRGDGQEETQDGCDDEDAPHHRYRASTAVL